MSVDLGPASQPWRGLRNTDKYGSGTFLASRDSDGNKRSHLGRDYIACPGDIAISPIAGKVIHIGKAYADAEYGSIRISGGGVEVRILYVDPNVPVGAVIERGQRIGVVQDITARYPDITPHVHVEVWLASNPELYIHGANQ